MILPNFPQKLQENEIIWSPGGASLASLLRSATEIRLRMTVPFIMSFTTLNYNHLSFIIALLSYVVALHTIKAGGTHPT